MKKGIMNSDADQIWTLMQQTVNLIQNVQRRIIEPLYGVTIEELTVLSIIQTFQSFEERPVTPVVIARWLCRTPNSVSTLVDRMAKRGLVKRFRGLKDRRLVGINLTPRGQSILEQVKKEGKYETALTSIFSSLSREEIQQQLLYLLIMLRQKAFQELKINWGPPFP